MSVWRRSTASTVVNIYSRHAGVYYVQTIVTNAKNNTAQSNIARITVYPSQVGGYSVTENQTINIAS